MDDATSQLQHLDTQQQVMMVRVAGLENENISLLEEGDAVRPVVPEELHPHPILRSQDDVVVVPPVTATAVPSRNNNNSSNISIRLQQPMYELQAIIQRERQGSFDQTRMKTIEEKIHLLRQLQYLWSLIAQIQQAPHNHDTIRHVEAYIMSMIQGLIANGAEDRILEVLEEEDYSTLNEGDSESLAESISDMLEDEDDDVSQNESWPHSSSLKPFFLFKVFHSAPLAYCDKEGQFNPIPLLDMDYERSILAQAVKKTASSSFTHEIKLDFDVATLSRLSDFLSHGDCDILHLSCFGTHDYLAMENGLGGMDMLPLDCLQPLIQKTTGMIQVVFLSTSCPRVVGEAFVAAGVRHVVCCQRSHCHQDVEAMEFARTFYSALSKGSTIKVAFETAKRKVVGEVYSQQQLSMDKYSLLPEKLISDSYHDVCLQYANKQRFPWSYNLHRPSLECLPKPTCHPGRRQTLDMHTLLGLVTNLNYVDLQGLSGSRRVAAWVARYVGQRRMTLKVDEVVWLPPIDEGSRMNMYFGRIFDLLLLGDSSLSLEQLMGSRSRYHSFFVEATSYLVGKRCLLVVNGKQFISEIQESRLSRFIADLLNESNIKIIHV